MDTLLRDIRCALRRLAKTPGFTVTALATLAICIGANLAIFAVVDGVVVRSLPFRQPEQLVTLINSYPGAGVERSGASVPNYFDRRGTIRAFSSISIFQAGSTIVGGSANPQRVPIGRVSPEFFSTLGVPLARGRTFTDEQLLYGKDEVAILTDEFWRVHFDADPNVVGRTFINDGLTITVVGVLPPGFQYLSHRTQFFRPASHAPEDRKTDRRHNNNWDMIARLAPGVTLASAQAQLDAFNRQQLTTDPYSQLVKDARFQTTVRPLHADYIRAIKPTLLLLQTGVFCLLLIGGVNLVNLLLIRASGRTKELAVRQALGASRHAIAREILAETTLLAMAGSALGLGLAAVGISLLRALGTDQLPLGGAIGFDGRLAFAAVAAAVLVAALLAVPVIWFSLHTQLAPVLHAESRSGTASRSTHRLRHAFIVAQVALAFVLLSGAGLLGLSFKRLLDTSPGFNATNVVTGNLALPWKNYRDDASRLAFVERLLRALRALPGVTRAAITTGLPFGNGTNDSAVLVDGYTLSPGESIRAHYISNVTSKYWRLMKIPLIRGRLLEDADIRGGARVCVVDQAFADRYWPGGNAIGHRLVQNVKFDEQTAATIVGVVGCVKQNELAETSGHGAVYFPYGTGNTLFFSFIVESTLPISGIGPMIQKAVLQLDPELPVDDLKPLQQRIDDSLIARRSPAILAIVFAAVALLLAAIGTYGVLSYAVAQRQREIGVRIALGALPGQIRNQFVSVGLRVLAVGTVLGLAGAWVAGRAMQSVLIAVPPLQPTIVASIVAVMTLVTFAACLFPARRAARVDPLVALRSDG